MIFFRRFSIFFSYFWLFFFVFLPLLLILKISFSYSIVAQPPYFPVWLNPLSLEGLYEYIFSFTFNNYSFFLKEGIYVKSFFSSIKISLISTFLLIFLGYPIAYSITKVPFSYKSLCLVLVALPFFTSFLIRVYSLIGIINDSGIINSFLIKIKLIDKPIQIFATNYAIYLGIVYSYLPFVIFPIYSSLEKIDPILIEAAADLGATKIEIFKKIILPLSSNGVISASFLVFVPIIGEFVIPDLLGNSSNLMIGTLLWNDFFLNRDWPLSSAVAITLLIVLSAVLFFYQKYLFMTKEKNLYEK